MSDLTLRRHTDELAVCRLDPDAAVPEWAAGSFASITRTPTELSVIVPAGQVPGTPGGVTVEGPWVAFAVDGPLEFSMVGVLAAIATPLAAESIPIFVVSTYDTDWILVAATDATATASILREAGHTVIY